MFFNNRFPQCQEHAQSNRVDEAHSGEVNHQPAMIVMRDPGQKLFCLGSLGLRQTSLKLDDSGAGRIGIVID
jgi:hypothetical protein